MVIYSYKALLSVRENKNTNHSKNKLTDKDAFHIKKCTYSTTIILLTILL